MKKLFYILLVILHMKTFEFVHLKNKIKLIGNNQKQIFPYKLNLEENEKEKNFKIKIFCSGNIENFEFSGEKMKICEDEFFDVKGIELEKKLNNIFLKSSTTKIKENLIIKYSIFSDEKIFFNFEQKIEKIKKVEILNKKIQYSQNIQNGFIIDKIVIGLDKFYEKSKSDLEVIIFNKNMKNKFEVKIENNKISILRKLSEKIVKGEKIKFSIKDNSNNLSSDNFEFIIYSENPKFIKYEKKIVLYLFFSLSFIFIIILFIYLLKRKKNKKIIKIQKKNSKVLTNSIVEWNKKLMIIRQKKKNEHFSKNIFSVLNPDLKSLNNTIILDKPENIKNLDKRDFSKIAETTLNDHAFETLNDLSDIEKNPENLSTLSKSSFIRNFNFN